MKELQQGQNKLRTRLLDLSDHDTVMLFWNLFGFYNTETNDWKGFQKAIEAFLPAYEKVSNVQNK